MWTAIRGAVRALSTAAGAREWTPHSRRVGLLTRKKGMTSMFLPDGERVPVTVLLVDANQISMHIERPAPSPDEAPYIAMQVAATDARAHTVTAPVRGHLARAGLGPKRAIKEFRVTRDALLPCLLYTSPSPRDRTRSRMPSSA